MIAELFTDRKAPYKYDRNIVKQAKELNMQLNAAQTRFNEASDSFDVEAAVYRLKELEMQYSSLLKRAKLEKACNILSFGSERL